MNSFELKYKYRKAKLRIQRFFRLVFVQLAKLRGVYIYGMENPAIRTLVNGKVLSREVECRIYRDRVEIDHFTTGPKNRMPQDVYLSGSYLVIKDDYFIIISKNEGTDKMPSFKKRIKTIHAYFTERILDGDFETLIFERIR